MPKLMIVDDDETMVRLLATLLEMDGFEVVRGESGGESLAEQVRQAQPDLLLMDVFLSDADGMELLRQLKAQPDLAEVPIIMSSGMDLTEQCLEAGANAFLLKPYTPEQLLRTIQKNLSQGTGA